MRNAMLWLPEADRNPHGRVLQWSQRTDPKGCLHTTEGSDWPTYRDWTVNPHVTVKPRPKAGVSVRQHIPFDQASFALRNLPGGVETNRDFVFQIELVGTCVKGGPGYYWPNADDVVLKDLFDKVVFPISNAFDIPLEAPRFQAYPGSAGAKKPTGPTNEVRLSGAKFDHYTGWLGHQHAPENVHGDPGDFPWARMLEVGMALTDAEINKIAARVAELVWKWDHIPAPGREANRVANPSWQPMSFMTPMLNVLDALSARPVSLTPDEIATIAEAVAKRLDPGA